MGDGDRGAIGIGGGGGRFLQHVDPSDGADPAGGARVVPVREDALEQIGRLRLQARRRQSPRRREGRGERLQPIARGLPLRREHRCHDGVAAFDPLGVRLEYERDAAVEVGTLDGEELGEHRLLPEGVAEPVQRQIVVGVEHALLEQFAATMRERGRLERDDARRAARGVSSGR